MKKVLVIGANSFVGSKVVESLTSQQRPVVALVKENSKLERLKKFSGYNLSVYNNFCDPALIRKLKDLKINCIINCAWRGNKEEHKNANWQILDNMKLTMSSIELANYINCERFINIGSFEEYGALSENLNEKSQTHPVSAYGKSKLAAGIAVLASGQFGNMSVAHIRLSTPYGKDDTKGSFINTLLDCLALDKEYEKEIKEHKKDYINISDVSIAINKLIESNEKGIFNLGSGHIYREKEVFDIIKSLFSLPRKFIFESKELNTLVNNKKNNMTAKIEDKLDWCTQKTFQKSIDELIDKKKLLLSNDIDNFKYNIRKICNFSAV